MFGFLTRKRREIKSPCDGQVVVLESINDEVFSQKMAGDGVAIIPMSDIFTAPIDGVVTKIFSTNHAYSIKSPKDLEVMVHIGLDTVALKGEGFERLAKEGDTVKAGDPIIRADLGYIKAQGKESVTPIVILDESDVKQIDKRLKIVKSQDVIMEVQ